MKTCENCEKEHNGSYGSGRFCSAKCARGFSTKAKRSLINEKVSKKLSKIKKTHQKICYVCGNNFETTNKHKGTCSKSCAASVAGRAKKKDTSKMGGLRDGGGKSTVYEYVSIHNESMKLNVDEIRVAKILDKLKLNWKRNWEGFEYVTLTGGSRKYYPDFYLPEHDIYIEYKGWVTKAIIHKMESAVLKNNFKLLIIYSDDKRYRDLGLNITELEINPKLLMCNIPV